MTKLQNSIVKLINEAQGLLNSKAFLMVGDLPAPTITPVNVKSRIKEQTRMSKPITQIKHVSSPSMIPATNYIGEVKLKSGAIRILNFIAMFNELTKDKARTLCGISSKGTFGSYLADLKRAGYIVAEGNNLQVTREGIEFVGDVQQAPIDTESLINLWSKHIKSGAIRMLRVCVENYPNPINRRELQETVGIQSDGTFGSYLADLKRNGLIKVEGTEVFASGELFE